MDDLIQVLVFLVTFIVFIASAIIKQKKKPKTSNNNFDTLVESIFGVAPVNTANPVYQESSAFVDASEREDERVINSAKENAFLDEGKDAIPEIKTEQSLNLEEETQEEETIFDVRKAVIYSAILNRKYF